MANVTFGAGLLATSGFNRIDGTSGAAIAGGAIVCRDTSGKIVAAQANSAATAEVLGIALVAVAAANQPVIIAGHGSTITGLSGLTVAIPLFLSDSGAGLAMPLADLGTLDRLTQVALTLSATSLRVHICNSGIAVP